MRRGYRFVSGLACSAFVAVWSGRASAAVIPYTQVDQFRHIQVTVSAAGVPGGTPVEDGASESSDAIGSFFRTMDYQVTGTATPPRIGSATAHGSAQQDVVFGDTAIFGTIAASATASHAGGSSHALADSRLSTHFTVAQDTPFHLGGQITMSSSGLGAVGQFVEQFVLSGQGPEPGEWEFFVSVASSGGNGGSPVPFDVSGVFHPGWTYLLSLELLGDKTTDGGAGALKIAEGRADFVLTVPEPGGIAILAAFAAGLLLPRRRRIA